jgi:ThiF family/Prokaryotic homologs of the JAB domain
MNRFKLRMTGRQHTALFNHLYPGDNKEAIAFALCGVGKYEKDNVLQHVVMVHKLYPIAYEKCKVREKDQVTWSSEGLAEILTIAEQKKMVLLKIHSHPTGYPDFSITDDKADNELFPRIAEWINSDFPGISAIMLPDGKIFARAFNNIGEHEQVESVLIAGSDIKFWSNHSGNDSTYKNISLRTIQAFGKGTTQLLRQFSIGVVGISGTGSPVVEQLFRLGVGSLTLVDGDIVKEHNVGRIYNSTLNDSYEKRKKVDVIADAIKRTDLPTKVDGLATSLFNTDVLLKLAQCDILFGCMDSLEGRDILNKLSAFYSIPYFDLGVQLNADGKGGVNQISGAVHYLQPDGSSLLTRGVYNVANLHAEVLKRTNPEQYKKQTDEGYIKGIDEDQPAVISVNSLVASFATNELLSRIHNIRLDSNDDIDCIRISLTNGYIGYEKTDAADCSVLSKYVGRGEVTPLLNTIIYE